MGQWRAGCPCRPGHAPHALLPALGGEAWSEGNALLLPTPPSLQGVRRSGERPMVKVCESVSQKRGTWESMGTPGLGAGGLGSNWLCDLGVTPLPSLSLPVPFCKTRHAQLCTWCPESVLGPRNQKPVAFSFGSPVPWPRDTLTNFSHVHWGLLCCLAPQPAALPTQPLATLPSLHSLPQALGDTPP